MMVAMRRKHIFHAASGILILLYSCFSVYGAGVNTVTVYEVVTMDYFFKHGFLIDHIFYPLLFLTAVGMLVFGIMGIKSFIRCEGKKFFTKMAVLQLAIIVVGTFLAMFVTSAWYRGFIRLPIPVFIYIFGRMWDRYLMKAQSDGGEWANTKFPYIREIRLIFSSQYTETQE